MVRLFFSRLRIRLTLLIVLSTLPVVGLTVWTYLEERTMVLKHTMNEVQRISDFASSTQERFLLTTRQLLMALSKISSLKSPDSKACSSELYEILSQNPAYANIGAILPDGSLFCSAAPVAQSENVSDQSWFRSGLKARDISLGMSQRVDGDANFTLYFSYPVADDSGNPRFLLFAAMDLSQLHQVASLMQLPGTAEFLMVSNSGMVLSYLPDPERFIGRSLPEAPLVEAILDKGIGKVDVEGLDGMMRLYAFTPLSSTVDTSLYVGIGIPKEPAYSEANRHLVNRFIGLGLASSLVLSLVWMGSNVFIVRRVQVLAGAVQRLLSGDLRARTGLPHGQGELDHLAEAFDDLAEALESRVGQMRQAEEKLLDYQKQLRSLSSQLTSIEERERQRIAMDLHDSIGQTLALSRIKLGLLKEAAASSEYAQSIQEIRELIISAVSDTKSLIFKMSSPILQELGMEAALQWLAEQTRKEHGLDVRCEVEDRDKPLDEDVRSFLFRAVSELLINVVKHSDARRATITVAVNGDSIRISVRDDGKGFDASKIESYGNGAIGFGLFSIRDRLSYMKGSMEIESQPGEGAKITLIAPLSSGKDSGCSAS